MGRLTFPHGMCVYIDTQILIYTLEKHPQYWPMLEVLWRERVEGTLSIITSHLTLMEALVGAFKSKNEQLAEEYRETAKHGNIHLVPITLGILERAAMIRATTRLKTPDAIHAATALQHQTGIFLTNDQAFRRMPELRPLVLDDVVSAI